MLLEEPQAGAQEHRHDVEMEFIASRTVRRQASRTFANSDGWPANRVAQTVSKRAASCSPNSDREIVRVNFAAQGTVGVLRRTSNLLTVDLPDGWIAG